MPLKKRIINQDIIEEYLSKNNINNLQIITIPENADRTTSILFQCENGHQFKRAFKTLSQGYHLCTECVSNRSRHSYEYIKQELEEHHGVGKTCTLLSQEYTNARTKLQFQCKCGNIFYKTWGDINTRAENCMCQTCSYNLRAQNRTQTQQEVEDYLYSLGYKKIGKYERASKPISGCICPNGHECSIRVAEVRYKGAPVCHQCDIIKRSTAVYSRSLQDVFRTATSNWRKQIIRKSHRISDITGNYLKRAEVHHSIPFHQILDQVINELGLTPEKIKETDIETILLIKQKLKELHTQELEGYVLEPELHREFHKIYGKDNNTPEQYYEFKERKQKELGII